MEDSFIVDLYWRRDEQAIAETERKYGGACEGIARRFLPAAEDAEEIVQDAYLSLWTTIPPQRPEHRGANSYLTVYFDGDQSGTPMYISLDRFPGRVNVLFGMLHQVG